MANWKWIAIWVAIVGGILWIPYWFVTTFAPDPNGPAKMQEKYGCKPTNEFVGKNVDRLWICADGLKYKEDAFYSWAYEEKRKHRGW